MNTYLILRREVFMVVDIVCGALLLIFGLYGVFKGFARQVFKTVSFFVAVVGAFLLVKPVYDLMYGFQFFKTWVTQLAYVVNSWNDVPDPTFFTKLVSFFNLEELAKTHEKTVGLLLSEYVYKAGLFVVLTILVAILLKILKGIVFPIADMPVIVVFDRLLGLALSLFWASLIIVAGLLLIKNALVPNFAPIAEWAAAELSEDHLVGKLLYPHVNNLGDYLWTVILFIAGKIKVVK